MEFEYKVVPAPAKGVKRNGARGAEDRFAAALETKMNLLASEGWEYVRCDTLPSEERAGLTQTQTVWRNLLVFRRARQPEIVPEQRRLPAPPVEAVSSPVPADPIPLRPKTAAAPHASSGTDALNDLDDEAEVQTGSVGLLHSLPGPLRARAQRLQSGR